MGSSFLISTVWLLCMLAAAGHGARRLRSAVDVLRLALPFTLTFAAALVLTPQPDWIGFLVAVLAAWRLIHKGSAEVDCIVAGVSAGLAAALYAGHGVEPWIAAALTAALLAVLVVMAHGAPTPARDPALLVAALGAAVAGLAPDVVQGWHSAGVLNHTATSTGQVAIPMWAEALTGLAFLTGIARGLLARK